MYVPSVSPTATSSPCDEKHTARALLGSGAIRIKRRVSPFQMRNVLQRAA